MSGSSDDKVLQTLHGLPRLRQRIVIAHVIKNRTVRQIARELRMPPDEVLKELSIGMARLSLAAFPRSTDFETVVRAARSAVRVCDVQRTVLQVSAAHLSLLLVLLLSAVAFWQFVLPLFGVNQLAVMGPDLPPGCAHFTRASNDEDVIVCVQEHQEARIEFVPKQGRLD